VVGIDLEIVETGPIEKTYSVAVAGFAGPGFIGSKTIMHIIRSRKFDEIAHITSELLPPMMLIIEEKISHSFRIYHNPSNKTLLITNDVPITSEKSWPIATKLLDWLVGKGVEEIVSIDGMSNRPISKTMNPKKLPTIIKAPNRKGAGLSPTALV